MSETQTTTLPTWLVVALVTALLGGAGTVAVALDTTRGRVLLQGEQIATLQAAALRSSAWGEQLSAIQTELRLLREEIRTTTRGPQ